MHINFILLFLTLSLLPLSSAAANRNCTQDEKQKANTRLFEIESSPALKSAFINYHLPFGIHQSTGSADSEELLVQEGYVMMHDQDLNTSLWASYRLTHDDLANAKGKERVNCFRKDPRLEGIAATTTDYKEPTFDQGHMANDADLKDELIQQVNSYMMSNMSPQYCHFNRGIWLSLEHLTRGWANEYDEIYVTSGAIFDRDNDNLRDLDQNAERMVSNNGNERVAIPTHYYKIITKQDNNLLHSVSFLLPHNNHDNGTKWELVKPIALHRIVTIEQIEEKAGVTLFPNIDRDLIIQNSVA